MSLILVEQEIRNLSVLIERSKNDEERGIIFVPSKQIDWARVWCAHVGFGEECHEMTKSSCVGLELEYTSTHLKCFLIGHVLIAICLDQLKCMQNIGMLTNQQLDVCELLVYFQSQM